MMTRLPEPILLPGDRRWTTPRPALRRGALRRGRSGRRRVMPRAMAVGDYLLDAQGNYLLNAAGEICLDDGGNCPCSADSPPPQPPVDCSTCVSTRACPGCGACITPLRFRVSFSGVIFADFCLDCGDSGKSIAAGTLGSYTLEQDPLQPCNYIANWTGPLVSVWANTDCTGALLGTYDQYQISMSGTGASATLSVAGGPSMADEFFNASLSTCCCTSPFAAFRVDNTHGPLTVFSCRNPTTSGHAWVVPC